MKRPTVQNLTAAALIFFAGCAAADGSPAADELAAPALPQDEDDAARMLANGALDSMLWQKLRPLYAAPLCVPAGELALLQTIAPALQDDLPAGAGELRKYAPWDQKRQELFFRDHPKLVPFRPILSFESGPANRSAGSAAVYCSRWGSGDTARTFARFSMGGEDRAAVSGRVDFTDAYGRWYSRTATAALLPGARLVCGNFNPLLEEDLFFGYFPRSLKSDTTPADSWLYGTAPSWNGVLVSFLPQGPPGGGPAGGEAFFHERPTERICAVGGRYQASMRCRLSGGVSYLRARDTTGVSVEKEYLSAGLAFDVSPLWRGEFRCGADAAFPGTVPFILSVSRGNVPDQWTGVVMFLPRGYRAPRSATGRVLLSRCGMGDTARQGLTAIDLSFSHAGNAAFSCRPRFFCAFAGERARYCSASIEIDGRSLLAYRFCYVWTPLGPGLISGGGSHLVSAAWSVPVLSEKVSLACSQTAILLSREIRDYRLSVSAPVEAVPALRVVPLFTLDAARNRPADRYVGVRQALMLFDRTFTDATVEQKLPFSSKGDFRVRARMSFLL